MSSVPAELSLDRTGCLGERTFAAVVERMRPTAEAPVVAEFGAGASTARFALELPGARIYSYESSEEWAGSTRELVARHAPRAAVEIAVLSGGPCIAERQHQSAPLGPTKGDAPASPSLISQLPLRESVSVDAESTVASPMCARRVRA